MQVASLGFRTDLELLRIGGSVIDDRGDHLVVRTPGNPNFWWGNFLLLAAVPAPGDVDGWIQRHRAAFPAADHLALGFDATSGSAADLAAFAQRGMDVDVSTVMTAQRTHPPRSQHPSAVNRALTTDDDWEQCVQLTLRCFGADDEQFVRTRAASFRQMADDGHGATFGAFLPDHRAGRADRLVAQMGLFGAGTGLARFQNVETDPDFRRQGLAGGLVHRVSQYGFDELGATTLVMVADPDYVAVDLYRAVGFSDSQTQLQAARPTSV